MSAMLQNDNIYRVLGSETLDIGFNVEMTQACGEALERIVAKVAREGMIVTEVGSWKGCSTAILANAVSGYKGNILAVDYWLGNVGVEQHEVAKRSDIWSVFRNNMIALGFWHMVHPIVMDSNLAAKVIADGIMDMVFLDADHRYNSVVEDIRLWLPKVRLGGVLCGHDCEGYYWEYEEKMRQLFDRNGDKDTVKKYYHPGVIKGVYDVFGKDFEIVEGSTIWAYTKPL